MKRTKPLNPATTLAAITSATPREVEHFQDSGRLDLGPSLQNFRLDLSSRGTSSAWNRRAAKIFTRDFIALDQHTCKDVQVVEKAFLRHIVTLRTQYREFTSTGGNRLEKVNEKAQDNTRLTRRRNVRNYWPLLEFH